MKRFNCILLVITCMGCTSELPAVVESRTVDRSTSMEKPASENEVIIDVRSDEEWESGHLAQAIHIPHTAIAEQIEGVASNKDVKIVLYCAAGGRAGKAKEALEALGYTHVENAGGYDDIKQRYESNGPNR